MKLKQIFIIFMFIILSPASFAFSFGNSNLSNTSATRSYVKYAPQQYNYTNRYMKQNKNYIYSPQQARYYGYRVPQQTQQTIPSGYGVERSYSQNYSYYGR